MKIDVFHFRTTEDFSHSYLSYEDLKDLDVYLLDRLSGGFTAVVAREDDLSEGICALSFCSEKNFNKRIGLDLALERLDNYLTKPKGSCYNPENYITLTGLRGKLVDALAKHLNKSPFFLRKGYRVFNPTKVLAYEGTNGCHQRGS